MFSKRSVSVQPSDPPIANAGVPDDRSVFAAVSSCGHVAGGLTPAFLNEWTLYQTVDLLAALKKRPYSLPLAEPSATPLGPRFFEIVACANEIGFSLPCFANCLTRAGWPIAAMSGGFPPVIAV